jgi:hypothetical protein
MKLSNALVLLAGTAVVPETYAFSTLTPLRPSTFHRQPTRLFYQTDDFREKLGVAYQDWCSVHGNEMRASRKEIFSYHYLLTERFFQDTGVRLELNQHADLTDQEYAQVLTRLHGSKEVKLERPPVMEKEHKKFQEAYEDWCQTYNKEYDESRLEIFSYHNLMAERYLEETGTVLQLNKYADRTEEEYQAKLAKKANKNEKHFVADPLEQTSLAAKVEETSIPQKPMPYMPQQSIRPNDWWEGGRSSEFNDWWEGGTSSTTSSYSNRSARTRWEQSTPSAQKYMTPSSTAPETPVEIPSDPSTGPDKGFWEFLGTETAAETPPGSSADSEKGFWEFLGTETVAATPTDSSTDPNKGFWEFLGTETVAETPSETPTDSSADPDEGFWGFLGPLKNEEASSPKAKGDEALSSSSGTISSTFTTPGTLSTLKDDEATSPTIKDDKALSSSSGTVSTFSDPVIPASSSASSLYDSTSRTPPVTSSSSGTGISSDWWGGGGSIAEISPYYNTDTPSRSTYSSPDAVNPDILPKKAPLSTSSVPTDSIPVKTSPKGVIADLESHVKVSKHGKSLTPLEHRSAEEWWNSASIAAHEPDGGSSIPPTRTPLEVVEKTVSDAPVSDGPSYKPSVLTSRKKKKMDIYDVQRRLLESRIKYDAVAQQREKARDILLAKYKFQQRLLEARIEYDAAARQREKAKAEFTFQQTLLTARIKSNFVQKEKSKNQFQQRLLKARIKYTASIGKHYLPVEDGKTDTDITESQQKSSVHEKLLEASMDKHFAQGEKKRVVDNHELQRRLLEARIKYDAARKDIDSDASLVETPSVADETVEFVSPYQGLTGPSKAGLALATFLALGMIAASPDLGIDWAQLSDPVIFSETIRHGADTFVQGAQTNMANFNGFLSDMQSSWIHSIQSSSEAVMGQVEAAKATVSNNIHGMQASFSGMGKTSSTSHAERALDVQSAKGSISPRMRSSLSSTSNHLSHWQAESAHGLKEVYAGMKEGVTGKVQESNEVYKGVNEGMLSPGKEEFSLLQYLKE